MSLMRGVAAFLLAAMALASPVGSGIASACEAPTASAEIAAARATLIVRGRITGHRAVPGSPDRWTIAVDNVLKGNASSELHVGDARLSACGDDISGRVGWGIILARGIQLGREPSLDAFWVFDTDGTLAGGNRGFAPRTDTIDSVAKALKDALPDTAVAAAASPDAQSPGPLLAFITLATGILLAALLNRRTRRLSS